MAIKRPVTVEVTPDLCYLADADGYTIADLESAFVGEEIAEALNGRRDLERMNAELRKEIEGLTAIITRLTQNA